MGTAEIPLSGTTHSGYETTPVLWGGGNRYVEGEPRIFGYLMLYETFPLLTIGYLMFYETFPLLTIGYLMFYDYLFLKIKKFRVPSLTKSLGYLPGKKFRV